MVKRSWWLGLLLSCTLLAGCNWFPSVRYDTANTGHNTADKTLTPAVVNAIEKRWSASIGNVGASSVGLPYAPVYVNGQVLTATGNGLASYDVEGVANCTGTPGVCVPQWTGDFGHASDPLPWKSNGAPEVSDNRVYVLASNGDTAGALFVFDLAGQQGCSGTPVVCQPLWTADVASHETSTVANGKVYVFDYFARGLMVFDAAGTENCSGTPVVCLPLWTSPMSDVPTIPSKVAVSDGFAYVIGRKGVLTVTDANGVANCSGIPKICQPVWTSPTGVQNSSFSASPAVADGRVFVTRHVGFTTTLEAFDSAGVTGCTGSPKVCAPLWSTTLQTGNSTPLVMYLAVAHGNVFVPTATPDGVRVYDAAGTGCTGSGAAMTCPVKWSFGGRMSVTIDNGLAVIPGSGITVYDAHGVTSCSAGRCLPLADANMPILADEFTGGFVTSDGKVFGIAIAANGDAKLIGAW